MWTVFIHAFSFGHFVYGIVFHNWFYARQEMKTEDVTLYSFSFYVLVQLNIFLGEMCFYCKKWFFFLPLACICAFVQN